MNEVDKVKKVGELRLFGCTINLLVTACTAVQSKLCRTEEAVPGLLDRDCGRTEEAVS